MKREKKKRNKKTKKKNNSFFYIFIFTFYIYLYLYGYTYSCKHEDVLNVALVYLKRINPVALLIHGFAVFVPKEAVKKS